MRPHPTVTTVDQGDAAGWQERARRTVAAVADSLAMLPTRCEGQERRNIADELHEIARDMRDMLVARMPFDGWEADACRLDELAAEAREMSR